MRRVEIDSQRVVKGPGWFPEVVAGIVEPDEDPTDAVRREILEEAGYRLGDLTHIATFYVWPGGSSERSILYCAEATSADRIAPGGGLAEEGENIPLFEWTLDDLFAALDAGRIADAKTVIAALWLRGSLEATK